MSTDWGFVCVSHDPPLESEQWFNRGEERLREIYANREALITAYNLAGYGDDRDVYQASMWLAAHPRCAVELCNEYGDHLPVSVTPELTQ